MGLLIPLFILAAGLVLYAIKRQDIRGSLLKALLLAFLLLVISTELLSLFQGITRVSILVTWLVGIGLIGLFAWFNRNAFSDLKIKLSKLEPSLNLRGKRIQGLCLTIIIIILSLAFLVAIKAPPNNYDSMTYHMARIPHWIQNQSIRYYPTAIPRQNYSMPLAEYAILHLQLLTRTDQYANLVQWVSFFYAILLASLIAQELKLPPRGQWISAALTATLPMAILQSSSTQNDLVVGMFSLAFAFFLLRYLKERSWENGFFIALSLGFAIATKGTAYIYCAAIGVSISGIHLFGKKRTEIKKLILHYLLIIAVGLALNTGIYYRNWKVYNNPIIPTNEKTINEKFSAKILFANLLRNGADHLATPVDDFNQFINQSITDLLGPEIDNPASTVNWVKYKVSFAISEDDSGNLLHFGMLFITILTIPWMKKEQPRLFNSYFCSIVLSIIMFSFLFKWQPWGSRLQIPIFLLGSVLIAFLLEKVTSKRILPGLLLLTFFLASLPYVLMNIIRPVLPLWEDDTVFFNTKTKEIVYSRITGFIEQYPGLEENLSSFASLFYEGRSVLFTDRMELTFLANFDLFYWYREAAAVVQDSNPEEIGLLMNNNQWEYPLWVLLNRHASQGVPRIYHIGVKNISSVLTPEGNQEPDIILATNNKYPDLIESQDYELIYISDYIQVLKRSIQSDKTD